LIPPNLFDEKADFFDDSHRRPFPPSLSSVPLRRPFPYARIRPVRLPARHLSAQSLHLGRKSPQILPEPPVSLHLGRKTPQILPEPPVSLHLGRKTPQILPEHCHGRTGPSPVALAGNWLKHIINRLKHLIFRLKHNIFFYDGCSDDEG